jgi:hypothetical protein
MPIISRQIRIGVIICSCPLTAELSLLMKAWWGRVLLLYFRGDYSFLTWCRLETHVSIVVVDSPACIEGIFP